MGCRNKTRWCKSCIPICKDRKPLHQHLVQDVVPHKYHSEVGVPQACGEEASPEEVVVGEDCMRMLLHQYLCDLPLHSHLECPRDLVIKTSTRIEMAMHQLWMASIMEVVKKAGGHRVVSLRNAVPAGSGGARLGLMIEAQNDAEGIVLLRIYCIYPRYLVLPELFYSTFFRYFH